MKTKTITALALCAAVSFGSLPGRSAENEELELPTVPTSLRTPSERAAYVLSHFWDALDFAADPRADRPEFIEQAFANYISVFPVADSMARVEAVKVLMDKASANPELYRRIVDTAEKYLYSTDSPVASDDYYMLFLDNILNGNVFDSVHKIRYAAQMDAVTKNRPGTPANNFGFVTPDGARLSLRSACTAPMTLLVFYDPGCDHCIDTIRRLDANADVNRAIADGRLSVVAVFSGDDSDEWKESLSMMPAGWTVGFDDGTLQDDGLYVLRTMPTLYLLDVDGRVVLKEASLDKVLERVR